VKREGEVMKAAMVVKFTKAFPGREKAAIACGREFDDFYGKKAAGQGAWRPQRQRVPRPERLPRHSYSVSRFGP
jgi:hypothetical protein